MKIKTWAARATNQNHIPSATSPDTHVRQVKPLLDELFECVIDDYEPIYVSDDAKIWDVTLYDAEELTSRFSDYYGILVPRASLDLPLWQLLEEVSQKRIALRQSRNRS
jgi:hypothetical protein